MVFPKARIVVAALLVIGWLGYLFVLVAMTRDPVILSRPRSDVAKAFHSLGATYLGQTAKREGRKLRLRRKS